MVVSGFLGAGEIVGISSFCRFWGLGENGCHSFLHFFRSSAWSADMLMFQWATFVLAQNETVTVQGRAVLLGDHTHVPKDSRRMPGVITLHQESETQSKPSYFRGHQRGATGLLAGSPAAPFCLPLALKIRQGLIHIGEEDSTCGNSRETLGTRIVRMATDFAVRHDLPSVFVLDAFFPSAGVFRLAASVWSAELREPLVTLIVRAKKNCAAYREAEKPEGKNPVGRPLKYGEKVRLTDLFNQPAQFSETQCQVCGKLANVSVMAINLLWKPTGDMIRFVLAVTGRGPIVLMCSDLNQDPVSALQSYCARTRIETMFDMLKNLVGVFRYRFWSKLMPRHSRKPKKNTELKKPSPDALPAVRLCREACERFVMLGAISPGLLQMPALRHGDSVWNNFDSFMRTRSRELPSERTVRHVIARLPADNFLSFAPGTIMREIRERYFGEVSPHRGASPPPETEKRIASC